MPLLLLLRQSPSLPSLPLPRGRRKATSGPRGRVLRLRRRLRRRCSRRRRNRRQRKNPKSSPRRSPAAGTGTASRRRRRRSTARPRSSSRPCRRRGATHLLLRQQQPTLLRLHWKRLLEGPIRRQRARNPKATATTTLPRGPGPPTTPP